MKVTVDLSVISARHRPSAIWTPGTLFKTGNKGAWYDPSDPATLFQDIAGTVPVTSDGDPVALMLDKSGNGHHAVQASLSARPLWRSDGTRNWLEFDGISQRLTIPPVGYGAPEFGLCISLEYAAGDTKFGSWRSLLSDGVYIGLSHPTSIGATQTTSGTLLLDGEPAPNSRETLRQALLSARIGTGTGLAASGFAGQTWQFAGYSTPAPPASRVYGYLEAETLTAEVEPLARAWMAKRTGLLS